MTGSRTGSATCAAPAFGRAGDGDGAAAADGDAAAAVGTVTVAAAAAAASCPATWSQRKTLPC